MLAQQCRKTRERQYRAFFPACSSGLFSLKISPTLAGRIKGLFISSQISTYHVAELTVSSIKKPYYKFLRCCSFYGLVSATGNQDERIFSSLSLLRVVERNYHLTHNSLSRSQITSWEQQRQALYWRELL